VSRREASANARFKGVAMRDAYDQRQGFRYHLKVHTFRTLTVILAWILVLAAFYESPEFLTGTKRLLQHGIEALGDVIPPSWGQRIEFVFREIGGLIWLQITLVVLGLRTALSTWRRLGASC
jgi:hypothetical protein